MRRVVITGIGIVSCLGNDLDRVTQALIDGRSGLRHQPEYAELGLRSQVAGVPDVSAEAPIDRKTRRFMGDAAVLASRKRAMVCCSATGGNGNSIHETSVGFVAG